MRNAQQRRLTSIQRHLCSSPGSDDTHTRATAAHSSELVLWGAPQFRSFRVQWALEELGVSYTVRPIASRTGETQTARFLKLNPRGKIPVLEHGSFVLCESAAIGTYLADTFGGDGDGGSGTLGGALALAPAPRTRARALYDQWCFFVVSEIDSQGLYVHRKHVALSAQYGSAPTAVAAAKNYFLKHISVAAAELQKLEQQQGFDSMRESLSILGASCGFGFSFADVLLTHCLHWAKTIGWLPAPTGTSAVLHRYLGQMTARSAYQRVAKAAGF